MGTYPQIKFYRGTKAAVEAQSPAKGSIWFNTDNGSMNIRIEKADKTFDWESYSGYRDVSFANGVLTFTKADGTTEDITISGFVTDGDYNNFYKEFTDFVAAQAEVDETQDKLIENISETLTTILDDDYAENGSPLTIRNIAKSEIETWIVGNTNVDFDTLEEMSAWLKEHPENAAAMELQIENNKGDIAEIKEDVGEINTVIETINTTIEENELTVAGALTNLDERVIALEGSAVTSVTGESYITAETVDGAVTVKATIATMESGNAGIALASDVRSYVDSQWEWGLF